MDRTTGSPGPGWADLSVVERYQASVGGGKARDGRAAGRSTLTPYRRRLMLTDAAIVAASIILGLGLSARATTWDIPAYLAIYGTPVVIGALWFALLIMRGSYDRRVIGVGTEEVRRAVSATLLTFAVVAGFSYLMRADISRAYAFIALPGGIVAIAASRYFWRGWLHRARSLGRMQHRTLIIGSGQAAEDLIESLRTHSYAGYLVVGQSPTPGDDATALDAWLDRIDTAIAELGADTLAFTPSEEGPSGALRQLAWRLEGRDVDLLIAPASLDIAGPRLSIKPAAGLPLLRLDEAVLTKPERAAKRSLDLVGSMTFIVLASPLMLLIAIAVRTTSRGPVLFQQTRIGRAGEPFTMLKFRTMVANADSLREDLRKSHDLNDPMFKLVADPRITPIGRVLRRWSLDELPQLFNVLGGSMSLVGPRPHPLDDVHRYEAEAFRRLAIKPGLTGLWQVAGRSDLNWQEALQLDLYYVETWSITGDLLLLARTLRAVIQGRGAH